MIFRIAETKDVDSLARVINAAFRRAESFFIDRDRIDPDQVREFMQTGEFLLMEDGAALAGCIYIEKRGERAYAGLLAVDPSRQSAGLGSQLMAEAEERCRQAGCRFMDLRIVNLRRELPEFYRRRGYAETGTSPFTAGIETGVPCHFINMSKPLDPTEIKDR